MVNLRNKNVYVSPSNKLLSRQYFNVIRKLFLISHKSQLQRQSKALESSSGKLFFKRFKYAFTFLKYTCELHYQIFSKLGSIFFFSAKPKQIQNFLEREHIDEITFDKVHVIFYSFEKFQITIKRSEYVSLVLLFLFSVVEIARLPVATSSIFARISNPCL